MLCVRRKDIVFRMVFCSATSDFPLKFEVALQIFIQNYCGFNNNLYLMYP